MTSTEKAQEQRVRNHAAKHGLVLRKGRRRARALDGGDYWLVNAETKRLETPSQGMTLNEIRESLRS